MSASRAAASRRRRNGRRLHLWIARSILLFLAAVFTLGLLIRNVGFDRFMDTLRTADQDLALLAVAAYLVELLVRLVRWRVLFAEGRPGPAFAIWFIGAGVNELLPTGSGEVTRGVVARERYGIPVARVLAPTAVERFFDLILLLALAGFALVAFVVPVPVFALGLPLAAVIVGLLVLVRPTMLSWAARPWSARAGWRGRVASFAVGLQRDLAALAHRRGALALAFTLTILVWTLEGAAQWWFLRSLGADMAFATVLGFAAISYLAGFVSFFPGGLGSREAAFSTLLTRAGAASAVATTASVAFRTFQTLLTLGLALGATALTSLPKGSAPMPASEERDPSSPA